MGNKIILTSLLFVLSGILHVNAQQSLSQGTQVTTEASVVSGKPYLIQYVGNNSCYVKANSDMNYFKALAGDRAITEEAIYYFNKVENETNLWTIQSRNTGKYFPVPTHATTFTPVAENAGQWVLNFQTEGNVGNIAPSCNNYSLNRSRLSDGTSVLHGWDLGQAQANQLRIYEIALSTTSVVETGQEVSVSGSGETTLTMNQWYVLKSGDDFFVDEAAGYTTTTSPKGFGIHNAKYLVRLVSDGGDKYYAETGFGNYLFGAAANTTTRVSATAYTAEDLKAKWELHPLVNPLQPEATEVYTLNSSGAWIFVPTGFDNQYYMFNVAAGDNKYKFAYPTASGAWTFSEEAVPVLLVSQGDGTHCITTKDGSKVFKIGEETHMTIVKSRDVTSDETASLNTALGKLLCNGVDKLTAASGISAGVTANHTDGWYALRIHSDSNHPEYAGNFLYTLAEENQANGRPHPISQGLDYMKHPLKDDATYYVRLWPVTGADSKTSAYITSGKGVTFSNGRVAFVLNELNGTQTNEYVLYSDDEGAHWTLATDMVFGNGKEAKLEVMNDNRLLATISRGEDANLENRSYNFTTGNASSGTIAWDRDLSHNWNTLNSYGRNNDILYYGRGTNGFATTDVVLHTVYNNVSDNEALRLYASFDQAATWNEFFTILPANAGVSAMQRLSDGNLAIAFEDGSIGGGANGSYALNYVVIHGDLFQMQVSDLMTSYPIKEGETNGSAPFVTWATTGWTKSFTTTAASGFAGVVVESEYSGAFNREGNGAQRVLDLKVSAVNTSNTITITAPKGFIIKSYSLKGYNKDAETYTLSADGVSNVVLSGSKTSPSTFTKSNIDAQTTTFTITSSGSTASYAQFTEFKVELAPGYYTVPLNKVNANASGDTKSYATLYAPFDLTISDAQTKAYYITEVSDGKAQLTETTNIPKLTAVLLVNSGGNETAGFNVTKDLPSVVTTDENLLKGTLVPLAIDLTATSSNYSFGRYRADSSSPYVAGFYKYNSSNYEMGANRAWLEWTGTSTSRGIVLSFDGDSPAAVPNLNGDHAASLLEDGVWYSLDGRRLNGVPAAKGIYVKQGKKIVVKQTD